MTLRPLRIEMITPTLGEGGMEAMIDRMARAFASAGHDVGITCTEAAGRRAASLQREGVPVTVVPTLGRATMVHPAALTRWLRRRSPDVVHIHNGVWLKAARAARLARVPLVLHTCHGFEAHEPWIDTYLMRVASWHTDLVVGVSEATVDRLRTRVGVRADKLRLIMNGIDTHRFRPAGTRADLDAAAIGHVARLVPVKNQSLLIDAFARVRAQVPSATLAIVGDGPLRVPIEEEIRARGLQGAVTMHGTRDDVERFYHAFDLFVLTSNDEGTSISVLEAMASGVCVVATAVGGTPALLDHGRAGVLVPSGDAAVLAETMVELLRDPGRRRRFAEGGRARAVAACGEQAMMTDYEQLYYEGLRGIGTLPRRRSEESVSCAE